MADYESSSGESDGDYAETGVLLGYASKEATSDTISHLGGYPVRPLEAENRIIQLHKLITSKFDFELLSLVFRNIY